MPEKIYNNKWHMPITCERGRYFAKAEEMEKCLLRSALYAFYAAERGRGRRDRNDGG